jgi:hypothetical protein
MVDRAEMKVVNDEHEPTSIAEVLAGVTRDVGIEAARALAAAFRVEFDEPAVLAVLNGLAPRAIEWRPPRAGRKRGSVNS